MPVIIPAPISACPTPLNARGLRLAPPISILTARPASLAVPLQLPPAPPLVPMDATTMVMDRLIIPTILAVTAVTILAKIYHHPPTLAVVTAL